MCGKMLFIVSLHRLVGGRHRFRLFRTCLIVSRHGWRRCCVFTMEEAWLERHPGAKSVHLRQFPDIPENWRDDELSDKWQKIRAVRKVVTGALEVVRRLEKTDPNHIGSSLEAAPQVYITNAELLASVQGIDLAEICITSDLELSTSDGPNDAFMLDDVAGISVVNKKARGQKCARSWRVYQKLELIRIIQIYHCVTRL